MGKKSKYTFDYDDEDYQDFDEPDTKSFNPKVMKKLKHYGEY